MPIKEPSTKPKMIDSHIAEEILSLIEIKGKSWIRRSIARLSDVYECRDGTWIVRGRRRMGDAEPIYIVQFDKNSKKFKCTCQQAYKPYAKTRKACTHIGACLFYQLFF